MSMDLRPWRIGDYELTAEEIADIVWLASFLDESEASESRARGFEDDQPGAGKSDSFSDQDETRSAANPAKDGTTTESPEENKPKTGNGETLSQGNQGRLYVPGTTAGAVSPNPLSLPLLSGISFPTPRAPGLIEKPALMRSLRPLLLRQPSRSHFEIDEEETAERIANALGQGWAPALRPVAERLFDLILLIEESPSMGVWQETVQELRVLLIQSGIFRDVHTWAMALEETSADDNTRIANMSLRVAHAVPGLARRTYEPRELVDAQQRRLILVVSDCSSAAWDNGAAMRLLKPLADINAVSILQVLPEELWDTTALTNAVQATLSSRQIVASNSQLEIQALSKGWEPEQLVGTPPIPVVTLAPAELNSWAHFMIGRQQERVTGYYFLSDELGADASEDETDFDVELSALSLLPTEDKLSVEERYRHFLSTVPPRARRLAAYFAAAPLTLPIMRMVQKALMGEETTHADLVWVYYSSLIERITPFTAETDPDQVQYDFVGGDEMRRRLLDSLPRHRIEQVQETLSRYVNENLEQLNSFRTALYIPGARGNVPLNDLSRHVAQVSASVLRYLGGVYAEMAERLDLVIDPKIPFVVHQDGVQIWVELTMPERVQVAEPVTLSVQLYTTSQLSQYPSPDASRHLLGKLRPGTRVQLRVAAPDGSFVVLQEPLQVDFVTDLFALMAPRNIDLQANALGEARVSLSFHTTSETTSEKLTDIGLQCTIVSETPDPMQGLRLRLDGDSLSAASKHAEAEKKYTAAIKIGEDTGEVYLHRGTARHNLGSYREAESDYSAAIKRRIEDYWIYVNRGRVLRLQNKFDDAISDFSKAILISPEQVEAYEDRGFAYFETGKFALAEKDFGIAIELTPTALLYRNRGLSSYRQGKQEEALADYAAAIALDPIYTRAYRSRGDLYREMKDEELAIADYNAALEFEESADLYNSRGLAYEGLGNAEQALADYARALQLDPTHKWSARNRGELYRKRGEYQPALAEYDRALAIDPAWAEAYNNRGLAYEGLGKAQQALSDYARVLELDPTHKWSARNRGELYRKRGDYQQALAEYNRALTIDPAWADAYNSRGLAYEGLGKAEPALADYARVLELNPIYKWSALNRGELYRKRGDYQQALAEYDRALAIDPAWADAYNDRGLAYEGLGKAEQAVTAFNKAIEIDPNFKWAYSNRSRLLPKLQGMELAIKELLQAIEIFPAEGFLYHELGNLYDNAGQLGQARSAYRQAKIYYTNALAKEEFYEHYYNRALVNTALCHYDQAIADCSSALSFKPERAAAYAKRADCYSAVRAFGKALADYASAISLSPDDPYADYNRVLVYYDQRDFPTALIECQRMVKLKPSNAYGLIIRGLTQARLRHTDLALQDANRSLELASDDAAVQYFCSAIFCWTARYDEAIKHADLALSLYPPGYEAYRTLGHSNLLLGRLTQAEAYYNKSIEHRRDRYCYEMIIEEIEELIKTGRLESKMAQPSIALFNEAIATLDP